MPNGGSDCCGTCWFNSEVAAGKHPYEEHDPDARVRCLIRDVEIDVPFWTYCPNHPHHNPDRIEVPIGPIYVNAGSGFPYRRKVLVESPDTPEIRLQLLSLLVDIEETPRDEYPTSTKLDETVIQQLGEFRERRAVGELRRILEFDPFAASKDENSDRNRIPAIAHALEALAKTLGDEALPEIRHCLTLGLDAARRLAEYRFDDDPLGAIRYAAVSALRFVTQVKAIELARLATNDVDPEVVKAAKDLLAE